MAFTNSGLVAYCKQALLKKTAYMWGGIFRPITADYIAGRAKQYPDQYPASRQVKLTALIGKGYYGVDCIGLVKSYYWGGVGSPKYNGATDFGVGTMYKAAGIKGAISTFPKTEGLLVMTSDFGHVGVYVGNGKVIESTLGNRGDGVVQSDFSAVKWAYWCQCPCITDDTSKKDTTNSCNYIYQSLGSAAKRTESSLNGTVKSRCVKGNYYLATQIVTPATGSQKWFKHTDNLYSAITDIDGSKLFEKVGIYTKTKANAIVNVRKEAGINYSILGKLYTGDFVYLVNGVSPKEVNGLTWVQVVYDGQFGWVDRQWLV